jgi:hypothetical protein
MPFFRDIMRTRDMRRERDAPWTIHSTIAPAELFLLYRAYMPKSMSYCYIYATYFSLADDIILLRLSRLHILLLLLSGWCRRARVRLFMSARVIRHFTLLCFHARWARHIVHLQFSSWWISSVQRFSLCKQRYFYQKINFNEWSFRVQYSVESHIIY